MSHSTLSLIEAVGFITFLVIGALAVEHLGKWLERRFSKKL